MAKLAAAGSAGVKQRYLDEGAQEPIYGVLLGAQRALAQKLAPAHELGLALWATGNGDARILAAQLFEARRFSRGDLERMTRQIGWFRLLDEFVGRVVALHPDADALRAKWTASKTELLGRAGWLLVIKRVASGGAGLDHDALLAEIERDILAAPLRKQETMNQALVEIAVHEPELTARCLALGERLGRFDRRPVPKGALDRYAPAQITATLAKKKRPA